MIFDRPLWLMGVGMALDSMRRGFVGGSMLSLFIIKEFGLERQAAPTLAWLRKYLEVEEALLSQLPPPLSFLAMPFNDYHLAGTTFLTIVDILADLQQPPTCELYWKED